MKTYKAFYCLSILLLALVVGACKNEEPYPVNNDPIPRITELYPADVRVGDALTIIGLNFAEDASQLEVKFNQEVADVVSVADGRIQVVVPEISGNAVSISVRSKGKISNKFRFALVSSTIVADDFNREDVAQANGDASPNPIGNDWQIIAGSFGLRSGRLFSDVGGSQAYVLHRDEALDMKVGNGSFFKLTADFTASVGSFAGVIFNAQEDSKRFYLLRTVDNVLQFLKAGNNGLDDWSGVFVNDAFEGLSGGTPYRVEVSSSEPGRFNVKLLLSDTGGVVFERAVADPDPYVGGTAGFYYFGLANPVDISFDNFHVEVQ